MVDGPLEMQRAVWASSLRTPNKVVLLALLDFWSRTNPVPYPGVPRLSRMTGLSERTVSRVIGELASAGVLTVSRVDGSSNRYAFHLEKLVADPRQRITPDTGSPPSEDHPTPDTVSPPPPSEDHPNPRQRITLSNQGKEPSEVTKGSSPGTPPRKKGAHPKGWTRVPDGWAPNPDHVTLAAKLGVDIEAARAKFVDHEFAKPKRDADACFRTWLRNEADYQRHRGPIGPTRPRPRPNGKGPVQPNHGLSTRDFLRKFGVVSLGDEQSEDPRKTPPWLAPEGVGR